MYTCRLSSTCIETTVLKFVRRRFLFTGGLLSRLQLSCHIATTHNDQHSGQTGYHLLRALPSSHIDSKCRNFSPDRPGLGRVNIYWYISQSHSPSGSSLVNPSGDSYPQGSNRWAQVQSIYYSAHQAVAPSNPLCLAEVLCVMDGYTFFDSRCYISLGEASYCSGVLLHLEAVRDTRNIVCENLTVLPLHDIFLCSECQWSNRCYIRYESPQPSLY